MMRMTSYLPGGPPPVPADVAEGRPPVPADDEAAETRLGVPGEARDGWVAFVGAGPGDDGLMTLRGTRLLGAASLVVAETEVADRVRHLFVADAAVAEPSSDTAGTAKTLVQAAKAGQFVVRLVAGDPLLSGAAAEVQACAKALVGYELVPGGPAPPGVPAYAGIALPADSAGELRVVHANEVSQVGYAAGTLVVLGAETAPADLGKMLIAAGWPDATPFAITWDGTTTDQQTVATTLGRIGPDLKAAGVTVATTRGGAVAVVGEAAAAKSRMSWYETKPLFGWRVLVPRTREQASVVSERLREYGAVPEEVPTIAVEPPRTPQQMERAVKGLVTGRYQWVAFTSTNAVKAGPVERSRRSTASTPAPSPASRSPRWATRRRRRCSTSASGPTWCRRDNSRPRAWPRRGRRSTTCSIPSTGCCCPGPIS